MFPLFTLGGQIVIQGLNAVVTQLSQLRTALGNAQGMFNGIQAGVVNVGSKLTDFNNLVQEHARTLNTLSYGLGAFAAGVTAFGVGATKVAADFDAAMRHVGAVQGILDQTDGRLAKLRETARDLGATTMFTATQAAEGLQFLAMAGFTAEEALSAIGPSLNLAAAAGMDLGRTADIVTNVVTAFGKNTTEEITRATDTLTETFTRTNTNLEELGQAMKFVGPISAALGISLEETSAAVGILGDAGIKAEMAGTGLRGSLVRVLAPTKEAAKVMEEMGINVKNADGTFKNLTQIVKEFERAQKEMGNQTEFVSNVMTIFAQRAGPTMLNLIRAGSGELAKLTEEVSQSGKAASVAEVRMQGLKGAFLLLKSAWEAFRISLMESGIDDIIESIVRAVAHVLQAMSRLPPAVLKWGGIMVAALGGVAAPLAVIARILPSVSAMFATTLAPAAVSAAAGLTSTGTAVTALSAVLTALTGPVGITIAALTAIAAAAIYFQDEIGLASDGLIAFYNDSVQTTSDVERGWSDLWHTISEKPSDLFGQLGSDIRWWAQGVKDDINDVGYAWMGFSGVVEVLQRKLTELFEFNWNVGILGRVVNLYEMLETKGLGLAAAEATLNKARKDSQTIIKDLGQKELDRLAHIKIIKDAIERAKEEEAIRNSILKKSKDATEASEKAERERAKALKEIEKAQEAANKLLDKYSDSVSKASKENRILVEDFEALKEAYRKGYISSEQFAIALDQIIAKAIKVAQDDLMEFVKTLENELDPALKNFVAQVDAVDRVITDRFNKSMEGLYGTMTESAKKAAELTTAYETLGIKTAAQTAAELAKLKDALDKVIASSDGSAESMENIKNATEAYEAAVNKAEGSSKKMGETLSRQVSTIISDFGKKVADLVVDGGKLSDVFDQIKKSLIRLVAENLMRQFVGYLRDILKMIPGLQGLSGIFGGIFGGGGGASGGGGGGNNGGIQAPQPNGQGPFGGINGASALGRVVQGAAGASLAIGALSRPAQGRLANATKGAAVGAGISGVLLAIAPKLALIPTIGPFIGAAAAGVGALIGFLFGGRDAKRKVSDTELANKTFPFMRDAVRAYQRGEITAEECALVIDGGWQTMLEGFQRPESVADQEQYYLAIVEWFKDVQKEREEAAEDALEEAEKAKDAIAVPRKLKENEQTAAVQVASSASGAIDSLLQITQAAADYAPVTHITSELDRIGAEFRNILGRAQSGEGLTSLFPDLARLMADTDRVGESLETALEDAPEEVQDRLKTALEAIFGQLSFTDEALDTLIDSLSDGVELPDILKVIFGDVMRASERANKFVQDAIAGVDPTEPGTASTAEANKAGTAFSNQLYRGVKAMRDIVSQIADDVYVKDIEIQLDNITAGITDVLKKAADGTLTAADFDFLNDLFDTARDVAGDLADAVEDSSLAGAEGVATFLDDLGRIFGDLREGASTAFDEMDDFGTVKTALEVLLGSAFRGFDNLGDVIDDITATMTENIAERTAVFSEFNAKVASAQTLIQKVQAGTATSSDITALRSIFTQAGRSVEDVLEILGELGLEDATGVITTYTELFNGFDTSVGNILDELRDAKSERARLLKEYNKSETVSQELQNELDANQRKIDGLEAELGGILGDLSAAKTNITQMITQFTGTHDAVSDQIRLFLQHLLDLVTGATDAAAELGNVGLPEPQIPPGVQPNIPGRSRTGAAQSANQVPAAPTMDSLLQQSEFYNSPGFLDTFNNILTLTGRNPLAFGSSNPFAQQALGLGQINISGNTFVIREEADIIKVAEEIYRQTQQAAGELATV